MKKILFSLFGIITLGIINFSSAGSYTYTGNYYSSSSSYCAGSYKLFSISIPNIIGYNPDLGSTKLTSAVCGIKNLTSGLVINSVSLTGPTGSGPTMSSSSCPSGFDGYICYSGVANASQLFNISWSGTSGLSGGCGFDYFCVFSGDNIINQSDLGGSSNCSQCESDLATCQSNLSGVNLSLSTCQSDLLTCQNSSSSCSPSGECTVNNKLIENLLYTGSVSLNNSSYTNIFNYGTNGAGTYCVKLSSSSPQTLTFGFANGGTTAPTNLYQLYNDQYGNWVCLYGNKAYFNAKLNSSSNTVSYEVYKLTDLLSDDIPCVESSTPECDDWTQLQCESEYDLIPESSITSEYCEENFNLIDPENCPASGGTGDVLWSSFFVNSHQVQGASNIYLWLPEFLNWDYTYIDSGSILEIDVENEGDQEYINNILDIQSYHPNKDQFALSFAGFLTLLMPYIIITLFIIFVWKLIRRIFR